MSLMLEKYKSALELLSKILDIKVHSNISEESLAILVKEHGFSSAVGTFILNGELYFKEGASVSLALHELLHIAVVEKEYRHMITQDTQACYAKINKISPERAKYRSESCTLGLQYHISKLFGLRSYIFGSKFFSGSIYTINEMCNEEMTNVPSIWRDKGKEMYDELGIEEYAKT